MVGFIVGFPEGDPFVVFVSVDDVLNVSFEAVAVFRLMLADIFAGGDKPAAVMHAEDGRGIFVIGRKDVGIWLVPAIIEKNKFRLDAILVGACQKILDVLQQDIFFFK
jgi:hypothetical protein